MSRTRKFFYNSSTTAFNQIAMMIAGLIIPRIMLKYYGSEINGLVSSITQFLVALNLVEAGLSGAATYALYKPLADNDHHAINGVVSAARKFYLQAAYIFVSLTIGLAVFYPVFVKIESLRPLNIAFLILIMGTNGALEFLTLAKYRVLLTADQKTYVISMASVLHIFISTLIIVILGSMQVNIAILRLAALLSIFLRSLVLMLYVKRKYQYINYKETPNTSALSKRWDAFFFQANVAITQGAPVVLLTLVVRNLMIVSVYTIFNMVLSSINGMLSIFKSGLPASFGDVIAKGEINVLQKSYREFEFSYYALITIFYSITLVMIIPFIRIYTSEVTDIQYDVPLIGVLFVASGLLYNLRTPQGMLVVSAGMYRETRLQTIIQIVILIILGIVLTPFMGIYGVLLAAIISEIYRDIDWMIFVPRHITHLPIRDSAKRMLFVLVGIAIIWLPFNYIHLAPQNYLYWAVDAIAVGVYACAVVIAMSLIFERKVFREVVYRIVRMVKK